MGIPTLARQHLYIETTPWIHAFGDANITHIMPGSLPSFYINYFQNSSSEAIKKTISAAKVFHKIWKIQIIHRHDLNRKHLEGDKQYFGMFFLFQTDHANQNNKKQSFLR